MIYIKIHGQEMALFASYLLCQYAIKYLSTSIGLISPAWSEKICHACVCICRSIWDGVYNIVQHVLIQQLCTAQNPKSQNVG